MKCVISSTYDDQYFFFLPITTWCWNKLGVDVVVFFPTPSQEDADKILLLNTVTGVARLRYEGHSFSCPRDKEATYSQCSRLYAAALDFPEDEVLVISDIDMALFKKPLVEDGYFAIHGPDLVPEGQYPMCYVSASVKLWRNAFIKGLSYQECLDKLLSGIECENMRGNYWGKDQETLFANIAHDQPVFYMNRARPGTQFAENRIDRDDSFFMDRLSPDILDYHMHRPGYTDENFEKILSVIQYFYPNDDLSWMRAYLQEYKKLL